MSITLARLGSSFVKRGARSRIISRLGTCTLRALGQNRRHRRDIYILRYDHILTGRERALPAAAVLKVLTPQRARYCLTRPPPPPAVRIFCARRPVLRSRSAYQSSNCAIAFLNVSRQCSCMARRALARAMAASRSALIFACSAVASWSVPVAIFSNFSTCSMAGSTRRLSLSLPKSTDVPDENWTTCRIK